MLIEYRGDDCTGIFLSFQFIKKKKIHELSCVPEMGKQGEQLGIETFQRNVWLCYESQQRNCMACTGDWGNNRMFHCCANFGPVACNESVL